MKFSEQLNTVAGSATDPVQARAIFPSLRDRHVMITGGGSGIGEAIVAAFVEQGARVSFIDIAEDESRQLVRTLTPQARHAPQFHLCDLRDLDTVATTFRLAAADNGPIEILINNAANDDRHTIENVTSEYWDRFMAVNLRHMFFAAQAVVPGMRDAGGGAIVNLGSISWHLALPDLALYLTAKAGIEGLTRGLARDLGVDGIRVNAVIPGGIKTPRQDRLWHNPDEEARILDGQCIKSRVMPADVAALVLFLSAEDSRMCTAHSYFVDAGWR